MRKVISALVPTLWIAFGVLFIWWAASKSPSEINVPAISGYWWFGTLLAAVFTSELDSEL